MTAPAKAAVDARKADRVRAKVERVAKTKALKEAKKAEKEAAARAAQVEKDAAAAAKLAKRDSFWAKQGFNVNTKKNK